MEMNLSDMQNSADKESTPTVPSSTDEMELLKLTVPAHPKYVSFVRKSLQDVIDKFVQDTESVPDIMLAVGEACNNAVLYNQASPNSSLNVTCKVTKRSNRPSDYELLTIDVRNTGDRFSETANNMTFTMPPAEHLDDHGRGMPLMQLLVDHVEILRDHNDTVVRLTKRL